MQRDDSGRVSLSESEAEAVRAALYVAVEHPDTIVGHCPECFQTITGVDPQVLSDLLRELDEASGQRARVDEYITAELNRLALLTLAERATKTYLPELLRIAVERGLEIPSCLHGEIS